MAATTTATPMTLPTVDSEEILASLQLLLAPGGVAELRAPNTDRGTVSGYFSDLETMASRAAMLTDAPAVYTTLNPVVPALLARATNRLASHVKITTTDVEIVERRWLPLDFDPVRPAGISATDTEHNAALVRAGDCRDYLLEQGFPEPMISTSGNGAHLLFRISLPNDKASTALIKAAIDALANRFSDAQVIVDRGVYNAARIWKIYGTVARKGDSTAERPHRKAQILNSGSLVEVTRTQLELLAQTDTPVALSNSTTAYTEPLTILAQLGLTVIATSEHHQGENESGTKHVLAACPFNPEHKDAAVFTYPSGPVFHCFHDSCKDHGWHDLVVLLPESAAPLTGVTLLRSEKGKPHPVIANAIELLRHHPWKGVFAYDEFSGRTVIVKAVPGFSDGGYCPRAVTDADDVAVCCWMQRNRGVLANPRVVAEAISTVASEHRIHPVREFLRSLTHDGVPRIDNWLTTYLGVVETEFTRAVGACWLISGCARVERPGAQVDHTLTIQGPQGNKKSTILRELAGDDWFTDTVSVLGGKDSRLELAGKWIVELSELSSLRRSDIESVKAYLSTRVDRFRAPYARRAQDTPRQNIFCATTNADTPLADSTGGRRFWCVTAGVIDVEALRRDRSQIWAEAFARYKAGSPWWLETSALTELAAAEQAQRFETGAWDSQILDWTKEPKQRFGVDALPWNDSTKDKINLVDALVHGVGLPLHQIKPADHRLAARTLQHAGWTLMQERTGQNRGRRYYLRPAHCKNAVQKQGELHGCVLLQGHAGECDFEKVEP